VRGGREGGGQREEEIGEQLVWKGWSRAREKKIRERRSTREAKGGGSGAGKEMKEKG